MPNTKKLTLGSAVKRRPVVVAVSGGFDPIHVGHVRLFEEAKKLGDVLVVILNNDNWLKKKKRHVFMPEAERKEIIAVLKPVDRVLLTKHPENPKTPHDMSVSRELKELKPDIFANGGDRDEKNASDPNSSLHADIQTCQTYGIKMIFNIGDGGKVQSSSWLLKKYLERVNGKGEGGGVK